MAKVNFTLDNQIITAETGTSVLEAALAQGIYIPNLCNHPDLKPSGACRLCLVDIEGRGIKTSCETMVEDGLIINTQGELLDKIRGITFELLITDNHEDCLHCASNNNCELQKIGEFLGIDENRFKNYRHETKEYPIDDSNPFFKLDYEKCVICGICIRTCDEIQGRNAIDFSNRGFGTMVSAFADKPFAESICESCGECVARCPVGALSHKNTQKPIREVLTTCTYCGVGCNLYLGVRGDKIVSSSGSKDNNVNQGQLCVKGRYGYEFINHPDRLKTPLIKKNGEFVETSWDEALDLIAENFAKYKGDEFATLSSARCTNEANYVIQKLTRAVQKTNNIDHCARLCHSPSVAGLAQSFGSGAMTNSIDEIKDSACIFAIGTNTTSAHPVMGSKMRIAVKNGAKLIVANPKRIDLCDFADIFLQQKLGTDVPLMMGMMKVIVDENLQDEAFIKERCENYDEFIKSVQAYNLDEVAKITTVPKEKIIEAARMYASNSPASIFYAMGITQHTCGTDNVLATSNLALLTGNVGKASSGVNPLRGQNNVQGACDLGALPNVYTGYQKVNNPDVQKKFEKAWNTDLSAKVGITHTEIFDEIYNGKIKAMYQIGENPVISEANSKHVVEALKKIDFFVAQDIFQTESTAFAHVILPAASFAENDGSFTNTERRVQRVRKAIEPIGDSKPDWWITSQIAKRMGAAGFEFNSAEEVMQEISAITPSYAGINYERLEKGGLQWPCPDVNHPGTKFLHKEKFNTASGKGKFLPLRYIQPAEIPDIDYPLFLTTDRSLYHYHTATMTRRVKGLNILNSEELLKINPIDAERLNLQDGDFAKITSRRGDVKARALITKIVPAGTVSLTFHFHETPTNEITNSAIDPIAKIPETKVTAVRVEKV
ncbi:MAG: formate dehydrogenase subunit alpha [Saprospiraceae bacterium]|nr:formate dehydrogenase subunit alpha [Saprospiraceae bacterium]